MPNVESKPVATSIRVDHEHTLEMRADMATKTAEVENVTTGEMYSGGGGDSDFSTAEVTFKSNAAEYDILAIPYLENGTLVTKPTYVNTENDKTFIVPLYKGSVQFDARIFSNLDATFPPVCEGDIELTELGFIVTGDGSITLKGQA